jgi:hypothetical protein
MTSTLSGLDRPRRYALYAVSALVATSTAVAFGESYRALYLWAVHHDVPPGWAFIWPVMVDVFVAVGELALFVGLIDRWAPRHRAWAWTVVFGGLAVSVAGNVGHVGSAQWTDRLTAAVPPVAAFVALTVGLGILKRVVELAHAKTAPAVEPGPDLDSVRHRAVLDHAESDAQRIRYAIRHGIPAEVGPLRAWLGTLGHDVQEVNIMSVLRRLADRPEPPEPPEPTGAVNGSNGHNGHRELAQLPA